MIRFRSASVSDGHRAISSSVRLQPTHSPEAASIVQTFVQGVSTAAMARLVNGAKMVNAAT
jgi:hypothetical protein